MEHVTYTKINTLYKRFLEGPQKGLIILGDYSDKVVEYLKDLNWDCFEKIDGTNFSIYWDGHNKEYHGKTERAEIKKDWIEYMDSIIPTSKLEEVFPIKYDENGNEVPFVVKIYGELHGKGIQGAIGKAYSDASNSNYMFRVFDIRIGNWWLEIEKVKEICESLGLEMVPYIGEMTIPQAEEMVIKGFKSKVADYDAEGLVCRPKFGIMHRDGSRIMVKIKTCDYRKLSL